MLGARVWLPHLGVLDAGADPAAAAGVSPLDARDGLHNATPLGWAQHDHHRDKRLLRLLGGNGAESAG